MKYHKIKNIPLEVCTAEQKIAYNLAFNIHINFDIENKLQKAPTAICKDELLYQAINYATDICRRDEKINKRYNIDAIISALRAGLYNYLTAKYKILNSYDDIGKMFPAYYLNN